MNFIGGDRSASGSTTFQAVNPATGDKLSPKYFEATNQEIDSAIRIAEDAFQAYRKKSGAEKAGSWSK